MKEVLNNIITNNIKYNNALGVIILIIGILTIGFYKFSHFNNNYQFEKGTVEKITKGIYLQKSTSSFGPTRYLKKVGIEMIINNNSYFIDQNEKDQWGKIFETVKKGDVVVIRYRRIDDVNFNNVFELNVDGKKIISIEDRYKSLKYIITFMAIILTVAVYLLIYLIIKKKKYNAN